MYHHEDHAAKSKLVLSASFGKGAWTCARKHVHAQPQLKLLSSGPNN